MRISLPALLAFLVWVAIPGLSQQGTAPGPAPVLSTRPAAAAPSPERRITLDVIVTNKAGNPVSGLQQQDFTLLDDKQPQAILSFQAIDETSSAADTPLQAVVLVDAVNASFQGVALQRQYLQTYLHHDGGELPLPTSLAFLSDKYSGKTGATRDGNVLIDALASREAGLRTVNRSQGFYGGVDRLQISLDALHRVISSEANEPGRKLLIWLGPGWPALSGPNVQLTAKAQEAIFRDIVALSKEMRDARITLYNVNALGVNGSVGNVNYYENFVKGVPSATKVQNGDLEVQVLAVQSGGLVLNWDNNLNESIARCIADRKAYYTLTFDSPAADHPNEYHSLQVKIHKPGLNARTRTGYYAQP